MIWRILSGLMLRLRMAWWQLVYRGYRHAYHVDSKFRFNGAGIQLYGPGHITLSGHSYIGELSTIQAAPEQSVIIGCHCSISHNVRIYTSSAVADTDFREGPGGGVAGSVRIEDGVWVGANCYIAPGVTIGSNSVVGANSVVTKSIPADEIWGGVPARRIRYKRSNPLVAGRA